MRFAHFEFDPEKDRLGEGPLSEVYRAVDLDLGRTVALKILRANAEIDPAADSRFHREASHTSKLSHPSIATIYEYGKDEKGASYIVLEYLEGRTLDRILKERAVGFEECLRIAIAITSALSLVHRSELIHRDLKPGNVMVLDDGSVKLLDFGIARAIDEASITQHGMLVGTVLYMSPEQVRGDELDVRSDVFALGSVLYHVSTGSLPFPGKSFPEVCMAILDGKLRPPGQVRLGMPKPLEDFILKCLSPDPGARYPDAAAAHGALLAMHDSEVSTNGAAAGASPSGSILIPPVRRAGGTPERFEALASSLRKDVASELSRTKSISVLLPDGSMPPPDARFDWILRGELQIDGAHGRLGLELERWDGVPLERREVLNDQVEYEDEDEWDLQAGLVLGAVRTVRKRLSESALRPAETTKRDVEAAEAHAARAHEILHRGTTKHLLAAISSFRRALDEDPLCAIAHAGLAEAMVRKHLYWDGEAAFLDEAREHAARALALDPQCAEAHTSLGFGFHLSGRTADAQREYRLAIQLDNDEWLAHRLLGAVNARAGNYKEASPLLRRAIALKPTHIGSYDHLFGALQRLNRYEDSLQAADSGIAAARAHLAEVPDNQEARLHLGMLLGRMGLVDDARAMAAKARELAPKDGYTAFHAACVYAIVGDLDAAMDALKAAQSRGYHIQSELVRNTDLDVLRGLPEFQALA